MIRSCEHACQCVEVMSVDAYMALAASAGALSAMAAGISADRALGLALALLVVLRVVTPEQALAGFANPGVATVALLFLVAAAVKRSGALTRIFGVVLGTHRGMRRTLLRLTLPVAGVSAFLNNTPVVAMLLPEVRRWADEHGVAASKLLIPLSYASIVGGMCTLIGTSTNLLVDALLSEHGFAPLGFFWISLIGVPAALAALAALVLFGSELMPAHRPSSIEIVDPRHFTAEFAVTNGPLAGKRLADIRAPGLRAFAPLQIYRDEHVFVAPQPDHVLQTDDRLTFAAPSAEILAMARIPGLARVRAPSPTPSAPGQQGTVVEAVVGPRCRLLGRAVGDGSFRREYGAAVMAVLRDGRQKPAGDLGQWSLEVGDVLLLEADSRFVQRYRGSGEFSGELFLITDHGLPAPHAAWHSAYALAVVVAMASVAALGLTSLFVAALCATLLLVGARVITWSEAVRDVEGRLLFAIVAALGLGAALEHTGAAAKLAHMLVSAGGASPLATLALVYLATAVCTEIVTNNAAAVLMLPIALGTAEDLGASPLPFIAIVMIAASASFLTPIGYQTNLMVHGAGGYRFGDFTRAGLPITLVIAITTVGLAPIIWPF